MKKVLILGGTSFDHIVHLPQLPGPEPRTIHQAGFHEETGSTGAGKALNLQRLGVPLFLYSTVGNDAWGQKIRQHLEAAGVPFCFDIDPAGTERHVNLMDANGQRISIFVTQSSENISFNKGLLEEQLAGADLIVLNILSYCRHLIPLVKAAGKPVWTDLHDYDGRNPYHQDFIDAADYIHLSSDLLPDYRPLMEKWLQEQPATVCMRYGAITAALCVGHTELANPALSKELLQQEYNRRFNNY
jgi:sugar/nucleoside kinase (ribokinase family)